jgi:hypothetical protein
MSTAARPAGAPAGVPRRTSNPAPRVPLEVVPKPVARASSGAFALFVGAVLVLGLLGLLALNTLLAQGAFSTSDLARKQAALDSAASTLQQQVAILESPQVLAASARGLGMVGTKNPVFLDPHTGKIFGVPLAGAYPARPPLTPTGPPTAVTAGVSVAGKPATPPATTSTAANKPGTTKPGTTKPGTTKPGRTKPGTTKPGSH